MADQQITWIFIQLLIKADLEVSAIKCFLAYLKGEEQRWQMSLWLRRMLGPELDQPMKFGEIWLQAEKIKEMYPEEGTTL